MKDGNIKWKYLKDVIAKSNVQIKKTCKIGMKISPNAFSKDNY